MSTTVFHGRVVEVYGSWTALGPQTGARMQVLRAWKGQLPEYVDVITGPPSSFAIGAHFFVESEYLITALGEPPTLTLNPCRATRPMSHVRDELLWLDYHIPLGWPGRLAVALAALAALGLALDCAVRVRQTLRLRASTAQGRG